MEASDYYNKKPISRRTLIDGDGVRNTHNFIKAVLIHTFVPAHSHVLDLGCGQGGDLLKYKRLKLKSYRGIDVSHTAIESTARRICDINMGCRVKLECVDFTRHDWDTHNLVDAVSCQFAIQYAFESPERADHVFSKISKILKIGGVFLGTMPQHSEKTYTQVTVTLPDDSRQILEYSVQQSEFLAVCKKYNLKLRVWKSFDVFCDEAKKKFETLYRTMRASTPNSNNIVFTFQKYH